MTEKILTLESWQARGKELYGEQARAWRFKCPSCGNVATPQDFLNTGIDKEEAMRRTPQECLKREAALKRGDRDLLPGECDWAAFGLFRGPHFVVCDGDKIPVFPFEADSK